MLHYKTFVLSQFQYHATLVHKMRGVRLMHKDYQVACKYIKLRLQIMHIYIKYIQSFQNLLQNSIFFFSLVLLNHVDCC